MKTHTKPLNKCGTCSKEYIRRDHYEAHLKVCNTEDGDTGVGVGIGVGVGVNASANNGVNIDDWANSLLQMLPECNEQDDETTREEEQQDSCDIHRLIHTEVINENQDFEINSDCVPEYNDFKVRNEFGYGDVVVVAEEEPILKKSSWSSKSRKVRCLSNALENIQRLQVEDQAHILRKAVNQTNIQGLETIMMSDVENMNEAKLVNGLLSYLKKFNLYHSEEKVQFCSLLWGVCGDSLLNDDFFFWLSKKLDEETSFI